MSNVQFEGEFVRAKSLGARLNCAESTIWRMVANGQLPQPTVKIGKRTTLWRWADVVAFLERQGAMR
jgi:predicted DNA-binding transcriptional regulator AlpA